MENIKCHAYLDFRPENGQVVAAAELRRDTPPTLKRQQTLTLASP
jgi:hypothetical protein